MFEKMALNLLENTVNYKILIQKQTTKRHGMENQMDAACCIFLMLQWCCYQRSITPQIILYTTSGPENFKKSRQKNLWNQINKIFFSWNCIFGSFKHFPSSKIGFWPFLKLQKMNWSKKFFWWNWFIWFHEFFWPGLF